VVTLRSVASLHPHQTEGEDLSLLEDKEVMSMDNIATFNLLLTSAIAKLYQGHPATITLDPSTLWPPATDDDVKRKQSAAADGTVAWLYRNGIVTGNALESNGELRGVTGAQLSVRGFQIANEPEGNAGGKPLGQVAVEAILDPSSHDGHRGIELVSRRFTKS
jgi:hypothetical protein